MKIALTIWESRISPVFDSAKKILIAEIENAEIINRHVEQFNPEMPSHLAISLNIRDIETLICGAISERPAGMIEAEGIRLIPFITGEVTEVLNSYAKGDPIIPDFLMPGCGKKYYRKCNGGKGFKGLGSIRTDSSNNKCRKRKDQNIIRLNN